MEATDWRRIADQRLEKLAAIARIGAEPPEAVLAIIQGTDPDPDAGTSDTSTMYHGSVEEFRRELVKGAAWYHDLEKPYSERKHAAFKAGDAESVPREVWDAHVGLLMAGSYAYTLAAVLGEAEKQLGPQSARLLASIADDILTNGDFDDLNADVMPGTPPPPPTGAEQEHAGQLTLDAEPSAAITEGEACR